MPNYFIKKSQIEEDKIRITGELLRHLRDALRIRIGERIICVDDEDGCRYTIIVSSVDRGCLVGSIVEKNARSSGPRIHIHLAQSVSKGTKYDFIVQKSTELGVNVITPVISERSIVKIEKDRAHEKVERWKRIAFEAAQQSGRRDLPEINPPVKLSEFLASYSRGDLNLLLWEGEKQRGIREVLRNAQGINRIAVLTGPEGGFSDSEASMAVSNGFETVSLGELILRTETAPIAVLSILQYEWGYMR